MICVIYVFSDMSEYEGAMLENNKEAILGTMWGNFVYKRHMQQVVLKTRQRDFEGKQKA